MKERKKEKLATPTPLRFSATLLDEIKKASNELDVNFQETVRFLCRIGITHLEKINYNIPHAVLRDSGVNIKDVHEKK